jgi:hypothetical protein
MISMKRSIFFGAWVTVFAYCLMSLLWGPRGLAATAYARASTLAMAENLASLEELNAAYSQRWQALRADPDSIALEGRSLGYLAQDEVALRLSLKPSPAVPSGPGERIVYLPRASMSDLDAKILALSLGFIACAAYGIIALLRREPRAGGAAVGLGKEA